MLVFFALALLAVPALARDSAQCTRTRKCNGAYLCTDTCLPGTVVVDPFAKTGLALQRQLQRDEWLSRNTFLGTHNSAISQAYGYGIEMDGIETLLNKTLYYSDDVGEGVCQSFSLTDQLEMGLRHLEIDITSGYFQLPPRLTDFYVCHSPVPLDPEVVLKVDAAALAQGIDLGGWQPKNLSCLGTAHPLREQLEEVRAWLEENPEDFVILYLDTKPVTMVDKAQANAMSTLIRSVFGTSVWAASEGSPLNRTVRSLVSAGKRLYIEDHESAYNLADDRIVFADALWTHQFGDGSLAPFPDCSIAGDADWYTPVTGPARALARGLYDAGSDLSVPVGPSATAAVRQKAMACGVHVVSPNYWQPRDSADFVWTWAAGEPSAVGECVAMRGDGRWSTVACADAPAALACRAAMDDLQWVLAENRTCPLGFVAVPPTNGYANSMLHAALLAAALASAAINVSIDGRRPPAPLA